MSYLDKVLSAIDHPKTEEIKWSDSVPKDCILRDLWKFIRYIPRSLSAEFEKVLYAKPSTDPDPFWWVLALTLSDRAGDSVFVEAWQEIWFSLPNVTEPSPVAVDFKIIAKWLEQQFDNPSGRSLVVGIYEQTMIYNGYLQKQNAQNAKNSDRTDTSTPSGK